ncbi:MAG: type II toxin-antitoxin system YafQ family toxin [Bacteroidaceae bacterium]|nr:type II toxin-antitoxin system YafQ family toxin [Bacteroidaceae bacterium]
MYSITYTKRFDKDLKRCQKRGLKLQLILEAIRLLAATGTLPAQYRPHKLSGNLQGQWECHIQPDWLLVWEQHDQELILIMLNTGTHSDLFSKKYKK